MVVIHVRLALQKPSLGSVRKYLHLIDGGGRDYHESVELLELKADVMTKIRDIGEV